MNQEFLLNYNELSNEELMAIEGGSFWTVLGKVCGVLAAACAIIALL
jgi:lactobin A/cerein 7B family class IIb bacteriocin